jgi:hypothetical protein
MVLNNASARPAQGETSLPPKKPPLELTVVVERPFHRKDNWQAVAIRPVDVNGHEITAITGVTQIVLSRFTRVRIKGYLEIRFGKYQVKFFECEIVEAEYRNPIFTVLARNSVPKARGEYLLSDLGEDFAQKIVDDPGLIKQHFPKIRTGADAILKSCELAVADSEIFQALNAVGAPQKTIDAASAFDLETQDVYDLVERGLPFSRADDLAQHPAITALQPFNPYSSSRIAHAALVEIKSRCGLWGHTGLPLADILRCRS